MAKQTPKIDRHKLKAPDEFITFTAKSWEYIRTHRNLVASAAGGVLLILILVQGYRIYRSGQEEHAASLATEAIESFEKDPSQTAPFERILRDFPGSRGARLARLYLGHALYRKGEAEKAREVYGSLVEDSSTPEPIRSLATLGNGYALVALKRCEEAASVFGKLPASSGFLAQQEAFLAVGRCHEIKGDDKAALARYEEFAGKFPQSPYLTDALRLKINALKGKAGSSGR